MPQSNNFIANSNSISGNIFRIDQKKSCFELIKETVYDPQSNEGQSRHTVYWTENTIFTKITTQNNFTGMKNRFIMEFTPLHEIDLDAMKNGENFVSKFSSAFYNSDDASGLSEDGLSYKGWFTPDDNDPKSGTLEYGDKYITVKLPGPRAEISIHQNSNQIEFCSGYWKATIQGEYKNDAFTISQISISPRFDPKTSDNPGLPRVLIIGDSISMNYHDSAKEALEGIANYHRIEENGGSSDRGLSCADLWLGDYEQEGYHWDLIQFNHGLHDLVRPYDEQSKTWGAHRLSIKDYKKNLHKVIPLLKKCGAQLMWCSTSPIPMSRCAEYGRKHGDAAIYNKAAKEVMDQYPEIHINDLHKSIDEEQTLDGWRTGDDVHFWDKEQQKTVGNCVASAIKKVLKSKQL